MGALGVLEIAPGLDRVWRLVAEELVIETRAEGYPVLESVPVEGR